MEYLELIFWHFHFAEIFNFRATIVLGDRANWRSRPKEDGHGILCCKVLQQVFSFCCFCCCLAKGLEACATWPAVTLSPKRCRCCVRVGVHYVRVLFAILLKLSARTSRRGMWRAALPEQKMRCNISWKHTHVPTGNADDKIWRILILD